MDLIGWNASFFETMKIPARKEEDAAVSAASRLRVREEGGCSPYTPGDHVNIPHDIENRGVATGNDRELNPQVSSLFPRPPQVTESAGSTSHGGDTGSNPVGTTSGKRQVRALVLNRSAR
jgi:hypothetical protein